MVPSAKFLRGPGAALAVTLLLVGTALWLRWPTFGFSLWNLDEAIHATAARSLLEGGVMYRDAIDQRTPLSYYAVAAIFAAFGENNLWAVRCFIALLVASTGGLLFVSGRALRGPAAGLAAGMLYVLLATAVLYQGDANAANTEWFVAFFSAAGAAVCLTGGTTWSPRRLYLGGALFGGAFLSKQPGLLDAAAPVAALLYAGWRQARPGRAWAQQLLAFAGGWLTPGLLVAGWLAASGALRAAVFYTWSYNLAYYGPETTAVDRLAAALQPFRFIGSSQPWLLGLWLVGAALVLHRLLQRRPDPAEEAANPGLLLVAVWSLAALAGTASSGRDFGHYMIQFLAPFCLGAGLALDRLAAWAGARRWPRVLALLALAVVGYDAVTGAARARLRTVPEDQSVRIAAYIREHRTADDRVFVWGYHPDIYLLSGARPGSRFLYASFLTGLIPWTNGAPDRDTAYAIVPGAMDVLLADLAARQPRFIVDCSPGLNRFWQKYPLDKFPALDNYVRAHYRQIEAHYFLPQGFRLFERLRPGEAPPDLGPPPLPEALTRTLLLPTAEAPLVPVFASARHGAAVETGNGRPEYFLHAPAILTYRIPAGSGVLRGGLGIRPGAYAEDNRGPTDGAEFIIRWHPDGGAEQILFRRLLRPRQDPLDRGVQAFTATLPPHAGGRLELVISPGPYENNASDWTYWADLRLERLP